MHRNLAVVIYVLLLTPQLHCLRGALFRSGRSFRLQPSSFSGSETPEGIKGIVVFSETLNRQETDEKELTRSSDRMGLRQWS
uniref:Secreted protein n=1 Tax=Haemonchus contortus TaxID=6289 RepID=A0A7I5EE05_HAECO